MFATDIDLDNLGNLQNIDSEITRLEKQLSSLPQRQAIVDVRQKLTDIVAKKVQVQDMLDVAEEKLEALVKEDEKLDVRQKEIEAKLKEVSGDYRSVNSFTKELNGVAKRREKLSVQLGSVEQQINKINPVMKQIMTACRAYEAKEKQLVESFKSEGGALQQRLAEAKKNRVQAVSQIPEDILKQYNLKRDACGPIVLARLENNTCSACRNTFDTGKLSQIRKDAPLAVCPSCRRLLIVEQ